jgi:para-nitrobenzyl esterase
MPIVDAFRQGLEAKVPYLVGYNSAEFPQKPEDVDASLARTLRATTAEMPTLVATYADKNDMAAKIMGDIIFGEPARLLAGLHAANGQPTFLYRFDVVSTSVRNRLKGTTHAQERQYVFDTLHTSPYATDDNDKIQAQHAVAYWTNFAKTGDPNGAGQPQWPRYAAASDMLLDFTNAGPMAKASPHKARWDAIAQRYPAQ